MTANDGERAERHLRTHEGDLRTITDAIPIDITVLAADGTVLYVNQFALARLGLSAHEVKDKGYLKQTCHPDDLDQVLDERRMKLSKGVPFELEMRLLAKSGEYRWHLAQYNPLTDETGQIIRWYVTAIDIDERKHAEQKRKQSEEDLRTTTDAIRQEIAVLSPDGKTLYANRVTLEQTGLTMEEVNAKGFFAVSFHPDDVDSLRVRRQEALLRGSPFELEMRARQKDGEDRWKLIQYNPLKDESGKIIRWYGTSTDIDDQKKTLHNENLVLREEIDRSSMFDEIGGSSKPIRQLLKHVEKVAPSDSTVLILGETSSEATALLL